MPSYVFTWINKSCGTYSVSTRSSHFLPLGLLSPAIGICVFVKTVPSKWAAPTAFIKIPAWLVAGKENIATLTHSIANQNSVLHLLHKPGDCFVFKKGREKKRWVFDICSSHHWKKSFNICTHGLWGYVYTPRGVCVCVGRCMQRRSKLICYLLKGSYDWMNNGTAREVVWHRRNDLCGPHASLWQRM